MNLISKETGRLFRRFINFFWFLSLCFMPYAQTSILISGDLSEDEQITTFDALRKITWPSEGIGEDLQRNNHSEPFEDVRRVQEYLDNNHIKATADYVPTTVWDLYFIYKYFKDLDFQERCFLMREKSNEKEFPKIYFQVSQELFNRIHTHQKKGSQKDHTFFTRFGKEILASIATELSGEMLFGKSEWIEALICEHEKIENTKSSLILEMIRKEYHAAQKNRILLVRATNGLPLLSKISTEQEYRDEIRKSCTETYRNMGMLSPELEEKVEESVKQSINAYYRVHWANKVEWFQSFNPEQSVLDFPLKGRFGGYDSAYGGIHAFNKYKKGNNSIDLSYATSLLAGYLYDGLNGWGRSACSFVFYVQDPKLTLYTLSLNKKWFFTEGATFFHVGDHPLIGILGKGELFHPRLRAIVASIKTNNESEEPWWPERETVTRRFKLDESFDWSGFNEKIQGNPEMKKFFQYVLKANEILSEASILSLGGELITRTRRGPVAEEAKKIIENQKRCSDVLIEKCKQGDFAES